MAQYSAYFDESTGNMSPILVVAGFLSTDAQWSIFKNEWNAILAEFGIIAFHAQHFALRKKEFRNMDEPTRQALMGRLLDNIGRRAELGFASVIHQEDFKQVFVGKERSEIGSVYNLACSCCHYEVGEWARQNHQMEPIAYFFDAGHRNSQEALESYLSIKNSPGGTKYRMGPIEFEHDEVHVQLQAADLAAYELWKWVDEHFGQRPRHGRYPLQELIKIKWTIRELDRSIFEEKLANRRGQKVNKQVVHHFIHSLRPEKTDPIKKKDSSKEDLEHGKRAPDP